MADLTSIQQIVLIVNNLSGGPSMIQIFGFPNPLGRRGCCRAAIWDSRGYHLTDPGKPEAS